MYRFVEKNSGYLFASRGLRDLLEERARQIDIETAQIEGERLLNTSVADLVSYFVQKYELEVPTLRVDEMVADESESRVDVSRDPNRFFIGERRGPFYVPGQRITIDIPFSGEAELFYARPSTFSSHFPEARVSAGFLQLTFTTTNDTPRDIRPELDRTIAEIRQYLEWMRNEIDQYNNGLPARANQVIEARRQRLLQNQQRVAALGIRMKRRDGAPSTYAVPTVRRKIVPTLPSAPTTKYEPEPILDDSNYENILSICQSMSHVMERSPSAFAALGEEEIRQHFLMQLNAQYEGAATGETFNFSGKTDILIREKDRNVFIAECKFWKGPRAFSDTIDQLLGYKAWRDTKTAIFVFTRDTAMSTVLDGVRSTLEAHPNKKRSVQWRHESGFRYVFHHAGDPNREFILTVLVFDVPKLTA